MKAITKAIASALEEFSMVQKGDLVLVAVSGGKDSSALLWHLAEIARWESFGLSLIPAVTAPSFLDTSWDQRRQFLETLCRELGLELRVLGSEKNSPSGIEAASVTDLVRSDDNGVCDGKKIEGGSHDLSCYECSRARRILLYREALSLGAASIAMGHHLDDILTTALMNLLLHGSLEGMEPVRHYGKATIRLIRPLVRTAEETLRRFRDAMGWQSFTCTCPRGQNGTRAVFRERLEALTQGSLAQKERLLGGLLSAGKNV